jgi:hypothetical protein
MLWLKVSLICGLLTLFLGGLWQAYRNGRRAEQLERIKKEIKERERGTELVASVINLDSDGLNERMRAKREAKCGSVHTKD